jgi:protein SCO1
VGKNLSQNQNSHAISFEKRFASTFLASALVVVIGVAVLYETTQAGQSFTTETRRRTQIESQPKKVSPLWVIDQKGQRKRLDEIFQSSEKLWIVDFVYTQCQSICLALGSNYQQLQTQIKLRGLQDRVGLLSISFDPARDNPAALSNYAQRFKIDPKIWQVVTLADANKRGLLLDEFGIMVIPAAMGEFEHNAAFHMVNNSAALIKIIDYQSAERVLENALNLQLP